MNGVPVSSWHGVTWSPELGLYCAVANAGTSRVMTSPDGVNWTARNAAAASDWRGATWSSERGLFCAVASAGTNRVMTSPDGINWTARNAAVASGWFGVTWSPERGLFCAVAFDGRVMTSPDGVNWTARNAAAASGWLGVTWSPELGLFCAVAYNGTNRVMTSPDGINWTARNAAVASDWRGVAWSPELGLFCAVANAGTNRVMTSPDGVNWTARNAADVSSWYGVTWSSELGLYCAVANAGTNRVMTSPDGINWTARNAAAASGWDSPVWSKQLRMFCVVAESGTGNDQVMVSRNGVDWYFDLPVQVTGVSLAPVTFQIDPGQTQQLTATVTPSNAADKSVSFQSSAPSIATVDSTGLVTGVTDGEAEITVTTTDGGFQDTSYATIGTPPVPVTGITIAPKTFSIDEGQTQQLAASIVPSDATEQGVSFESSDNSIATVSTAGLVSGIKPGTVVITVTSDEGGFTDTANGTINAVVIPVTGVTLAPEEVNLTVPETIHLTATVLPTNATNKNISFISSDDNIATVNGIGTVTAITEGIATITVKTEDGNFTASTTVNVSPEIIKVTGVTIEPDTAEIFIGQTQQLAATVSPPDASDKSVSFDSNDESVATVDAAGLVTGISEGIATITVTTTDGGFTDSAVIGVNAPLKPVTGVTLTPKTLEMLTGETEQLTVAVIPDDADNKNVLFESSDNFVAIVDTTGLVTATGDGTAMITVTTVDGGFQDTATVTVETVIIPVSGVTLAPDTLPVSIGKYAQLTATVEPANATNKTVSYSSSNSDIATVSASGLVFGVAEGTAIITVITEDGGFTAEATVAVSVAVIPVTGVSINPSRVTIIPGNSARVTAVITPSNATNKNITYSSDNISVATVDQMGLVTAIAEGVANITAITSDGGFMATSAVTVSLTPPPEDKNEFLPFSIAAESNVMAQDAYENEPKRTDGFPRIGRAPSNLGNKATRQASNMGAAIGEFIRRQGLDVEDNGDIALLAYKFEQAVRILVARS